MSRMPPEYLFQGGYGADSSYDDIVSYSSYPSPAALGSGYTYGRYYNEPDAKGILATYTSPEWNVKTPGELKLRSVSWTLWWPLRNRNKDSNLDDTPLVGVDLNSVYQNDPCHSQ